MRIIEQKIADAIKARRSFTGGNTSVVKHNDLWEVYLHGKRIAVIGLYKVELYSCGYKVPLTVSRMNAILRGLGVQERVWLWLDDLWVDNWRFAPASRSDTPFYEGFELQFDGAEQ